MTGFEIIDNSGITVRNNYITKTSGNLVLSNIENSDNILVSRNFFQIGSYSTCLRVVEGCQNIKVDRNIFHGTSQSLLHTSQSFSMSASPVQSALFKNNVSEHKNNFHYADVFNNIFYNPNGSGIQGSNNTLLNNFTTFTNMFVGWPSANGYSFDSRFQLAPGSPAIGAGNDGLDCGVFSGDFPYKLSGIPDIPLTYELNVPENATGGSMDVNIKVRAEN